MYLIRCCDPRVNQRTSHGLLLLCINVLPNLDVDENKSKRQHVFSYELDHEAHETGKGDHRFHKVRGKTENRNESSIFVRIIQLPIFLIL